MSEKLLSFRWWCHLENKMVYVSWRDVKKGRSVCSFDTVMRAAMLLKDDKILYEGDIVSWSEYQGWEDGRTFHGLYIVEWNDNEQKWILKDPFNNEDFDFWNTDWDDVVGNIYENKDWLPNDEEEKEGITLT